MMTLARTAFHGNRALTLLAGAMSATLLISLVALAVDRRTLAGQPIWLKPAKFSASLAIYGFTLAWLLAHVRKGRRLAAWAGGVIAVGTVVEMGIIVGQATRGRASHFNEATALDTALWRSLGGVTVGLSLATIAIAVLLWRDGMPDRAGTWVVRLGLVLLLAGFVEGGLMVVPTAEQLAAAEHGRVTSMGAHAVGVPDGGPGLPVTGWSTTGGDLRIGHFVGIHAPQALLLFGMLLSWLVAQPARRTRLVFVFAAAYGGLLVLVTWQALRGQPLLDPDAVTLAAAGALAVAIAVAAAVAWFRPVAGRD
ncbi:hypothetical protein [Micromonospora sp. CPCC 206061]|uniref:hypothetical protein n=1 Tax=Micromonospora sp. CPCC 206061 TaxID=3122410 RepID=UPI002FF141B2